MLHLPDHTAASSVPQAIVFRARNLSKVYLMGEVAVHALRDIDLDIYEREFAVLRLSGSGKSTLLFRRVRAMTIVHFLFMYLKSRSGLLPRTVRYDRLPNPALYASFQPYQRIQATLSSWIGNECSRDGAGCSLSVPPPAPAAGRLMGFGAR